MRVHLTMRSSNRKTGRIPVSTTSSESCPVSCPHRGTTCYAGLGKLSLWWGKVTRGDAGTRWDAFLARVRSIPEGGLWRHNQAGDLRGDGTRIDRAALRGLTAAQRGRRGWTYTHYLHGARGADAMHNLWAVREASAGGFTINASAESLAEADLMRDLGLPTVVVLPSDTTARTLTTPAGRTVTVCPATYRDTGPGSSCETCGLCAVDSPARSIVGFPGHGARARALDARLALFAQQGVEGPS